MSVTPKFSLILSFALLLGIVWLDVSSRSEVRITSLYLIPTLIVTWNNSRKWGYLFAAIAIAFLFVDNNAAGTNQNGKLYFYIETFGRIISFFIVIFMASSSRAAYDRERSSARTDGLTLLMNRHAFYLSLEVEIARGTRHFKPYALLYLDCDNFKEINDTMGHNEGDALLRLIAETMRNNVRKGDLIARLGGDEFVIFFPETGEAEIAVIAAELSRKLNNAVSHKYACVSFSIGIAVFVRTSPSLDEVIMRADQLMYQVKSTGKNGLLQQAF